MRPTAIVPKENEEDFNSRESSEEKRAPGAKNNSNIYVEQSRLNLADDSSFIEEQNHSRHLK